MDTHTYKAQLTVINLARQQRIERWKPYLLLNLVIYPRTDLAPVILTVLLARWGCSERLKLVLSDLVIKGHS